MKFVPLCTLGEVVDSEAAIPHLLEVNILRKALRWDVIEAIWRRTKYLGTDLNGAYLAIHLPCNLARVYDYMK